SKKIMCEGVGCFTSSRIDFQLAVVIVARLRTVLLLWTVEPIQAMSASAVEDDSVTEYQAFRVELKEKVAHVAINRPDKVNAMNAAFWSEIVDIFQWIDDTDEVRVVVLSGEGKHFSAGIDLQLLAQAATQLGSDIGRNAERLRRQILTLQASFNAVDKCRKPVIAAIQGYCIGGAIDLI